MKKTLLATAVIASCAAATAQAGTFTNGTTRPIVGSEIFGTGSEAVAIAAPVATYTLLANPESDFNVVLTLDSGTFGADLASNSLVANGDASTDGNDNDVSVALVSGGSDADSTATFRINNASGASGLENGDTLVFTYTVDNVTSVLGTSGGDVGLSITLSDNLGTLDTTQTLEAVQSQAAFTSTVTAGVAGNDNLTSAPSIDVATSNVNFTAVTNVSTTTDTILGAITTDLNTFDDTVAAGGAAAVGTTIKEDDGTTAIAMNAAGVANDFGVNAFTVTVTGDFTASLNTNTDASATTADGVYVDLDANGTHEAGEEADTLTSTTATINLTAADTANLVANDYNIRMTVDGSTAIVPQSTSATVLVDFTTATEQDLSFTGNMRSLSKNGSNTTMNYALTPNGAFGQFFRVVNTSTVTGDVSFTITTDAGTTSNSVLLASVAGQTTSSVAGGASTSLFSLNDMYAAVQAAQSTFDAGTGKLRVTLSGEFPTMDVDTIALSKDGNSFSLLNN